MQAPAPSGAGHTRTITRPPLVASLAAVRGILVEFTTRPLSTTGKLSRGKENEFHPPQLEAHGSASSHVLHTDLSIHCRQSMADPKGPGPTMFLNEFCNKKGALCWHEVWLFIVHSYLTGKHAVMTFPRWRQLQGPGPGRLQCTFIAGTPWCPCHTCTRSTRAAGFIWQ